MDHLRLGVSDMPRIPTYQPGQVGPVQTTQARFRAPDMGGSAAGGLGAGLADLGRSIGGYAEMQDHLNAQNDDTQARKMAAEAHSKISGLVQQFGTQLGSNARVAQPDTMQQLEKIRDDYIGQASNPRMKQLLEERMAPLFADSQSSVFGHAIKQAQVERVSSFDGTISMNADSAMKSDDPAKRLAYFQAGSAAVNQKLDFMGVTDPDARALELRKYSSDVHRGVLDGMLANPDTDVHLVQAYLAAHKDEMLDKDALSIERDLKAPLQRQQAASDFMDTIGEARPDPSASGGDMAGRMTAITAKSESGGKERGPDGQLITSPKGAQGAMQVMPGTRIDPGFGVKPAQDNSDAERTRVGRDYLNALMQRYDDPAKAWAAYNAGPGKLESAVKDHGAGWLNAMPAETRGYVQKNMAALNGHDEKPREWDKNQAYDRIDKKAEAEGWSFERREAAKRYADTAIGRDEDLLKRQRDQANEQALQGLVKLGDGFTSINQLPRSVRDSLAPDDYLRLDKLAQGNAKKKATIPAKGEIATALEIMKRAEPDKFAKEDLFKYAGKVSADELRGFVLDQVESQKKAKTADEAFDPTTGIDAAIQRAKRFQKLEVGDRDYIAVFDTMKQSVAAARQKKGVVTAADFDQAFKDAYRQTKVGAGWISSGKKAYEVGQADIPREWRTSFLRNWPDKSRAPSEDEMLRAYRMDN
jgi:soluble lytic murein transglycosylase